FGTRRGGSIDFALAVSACAGAHLLFGVLFAAVSGEGTDRTARNPPGGRVAGRRAPGRCSALLGRAFAAVDLEQRPHADGADGYRPRRVAASGRECVAARDA